MRKSEEIAWLRGMVSALRDDNRDLQALVRELVNPQDVTVEPFYQDLVPNSNGGPRLHPEPVPEWEAAPPEPANWADLAEIEGSD